MTIYEYAISIKHDLIIKFLCESVCYEVYFENLYMYDKFFLNFREIFGSGDTIESALISLINEIEGNRLYTNKENSIKVPETLTIK
jgi:hypothetical protein